VPLPQSGKVDPHPPAAETGETADACPGCGARVPDPGQGAPPLVGASPGCWAVYGDVLAREYGDWANPPVHRLTVDTYGAQHPGPESPRAARAMAGHLIGLHLWVERGVEPRRVARELGRSVADPSALHWLEPPDPEGQISILSVQGAPTIETHTARVERWARSVWEAWAGHHEIIRRWAGR
jgi:hypothetical protein